MEGGCVCYLVNLDGDIIIECLEVFNDKECYYMYLIMNVLFLVINYLFII